MPYHFLLLAAFLFLNACGRYQPTEQPGDAMAIELSQELLEVQRAGGSAANLLPRLAELDPRQLAAELDERDEKLAFWINVYNGMAQHFLRGQPELWEDRGDFFSAERFTVAGELLSLEDVEHGIIRGGEAKLGLGFIPKLFQDKFARTFKVKGGEARIHFALNCGAIDCPPVEIYEPATLDERLDHRSRVYLNKHSSLSEDGETLTTSPLLSWFRGDFGSYGGVDDFLVRYDVLTEENKKVKRNYKDYDWTLATDVWAKD